MAASSSTSDQPQPTSSSGANTSSGASAIPGVVKRQRHGGNTPSLPQTKICPLCPAKFTRTTHLNRHLRSHNNERLYRCDICQSQFTRSDLLARHKRTCGDPVHATRSRQKACLACAQAKIKCDLVYPCSKCSARGRFCIFVNDPEVSRNKKAVAERKAAGAAAGAGTTASSSSGASPSRASSSSASPQLSVQGSHTPDICPPEWSSLPIAQHEYTSPNSGQSLATMSDQTSESYVQSEAGNRRWSEPALYYAAPPRYSHEEVAASSHMGSRRVSVPSPPQNHPSVSMASHSQEGLLPNQHLTSEMFSAHPFTQVPYPQDRSSAAHMRWSMALPPPRAEAQYMPQPPSSFPYDNSTQYAAYMANPPPPRAHTMPSISMVSSDRARSEFQESDVRRSGPEMNLQSPADMQTQPTWLTAWKRSDGQPERQ